MPEFKTTPSTRKSFFRTVPLPLECSCCAFPADSRAGTVLFLVLGMLALVSTLAASVFYMTRTDIQISGNYKTGSEAFHQAEAAVHYVKDLIEKDVVNDVLSWQAPTQSVSYTAPTGFSFDPVTALVQMPHSNTYLYTVTGRSLKSSSTIDVMVRRSPMLALGIFGNDEVDLKAYANIYSYNGNHIANPTPSDSDGHGDTASNGNFYIHMGTYLDGMLAIGEAPDGTEGVLQASGDPIVTGKMGLEVDYIEQDPMGALGGEIAAEIAAAATSNDNLAVSPPIAGPQYDISLGNGDSMTLPSGTYYVKDITLMNGSTLDIDAGGGPVTIYLTGSGNSGAIEAKNGSTININADPGDFRIYSDTDESIVFKHGGHFKGYIYAPYADITIMNSADAYGLFWGNSVELKNSGDVYIDTSLTEERLSDDIDLVSWKLVR
jgi:hypothetical protein